MKEKAPETEDPTMMALVRAIACEDSDQAVGLIDAHPQLATMRVRIGATRADAKSYFFEQISHYVYAGDSVLHVAAAAHNDDISRRLLKNGADVGAKNRRGAEPLHYASDSMSMVSLRKPQAQVETISLLIAFGANPNAVDMDGVAPLHRAVRTRSIDAVRALLAGGADFRQRNKNGSTALHLAVQNTGRGGSGAAEAKSHQKNIIELLLKAGADLDDEDFQGKSVRACIKEEWIKKLLL
jgi:ankyrin repeat protein